MRKRVSKTESYPFLKLVNLLGSRWFAVLRPGWHHGVGVRAQEYIEDLARRRIFGVENRAVFASSQKKGLGVHRKPALFFVAQMAVTAQLFDCRGYLVCEIRGGGERLRSLSLFCSVRAGLKPAGEDNGFGEQRGLLEESAHWEVKRLVGER